MGNQKLKPVIVVFMGGCCGDLLTLLIDWTGAVDDHDAGIMRMSQDRQQLKKPHLFANTQEKIEYLEHIGQQYCSLPSHDIEFHQQCNHEFVGIAVKEYSTAVWAAQRFKESHRPQVWQEVERACDINSVEKYAELIMHYSNKIKLATPNIVYLEDILEGKAVTVIENMLGIEVDDRVKTQHYPAWLERQQGK